MNLSAEVVTLTPQLATELLATNTNNRQLGPAVVSAYAKLMDEGMWSDGVAVVAIATNGVLVNGQHVCHAVIKSQQSVQVVMVSGISPESFAAFDAHRKRTTGQTLSLAGVPNANAVAAIIRRSMIIDGGGKHLSLSLSNTETNAIYQSDPARWDLLAQRAREVYQVGRRDGVLLAAAAIGGFLHVAESAGLMDEAHRFALAVADVSGHQPGLPATSLRRWLSTAQRGGGGRLGMIEHSAWVRAFNAHIEGRSLSKLYASSDSIPAISKPER